MEREVLFIIRVIMYKFLKQEDHVLVQVSVLVIVAGVFFLLWTCVRSTGVRQNGQASSSEAKTVEL